MGDDDENSNKNIQKTLCLIITYPARGAVLLLLFLAKEFPFLSWL